VVEATGGTAAKHGRTGLVDTLVELRGAHVPLLVIVVGRARHDLGVRGVD
jgi:hypothetical protein